MTAILFDVDGVLIDSLSVHRQVWRAWAESHRLDAEIVWRATFGRRPEDTVAITAPGLDPVVERRALDAHLQALETEMAAMPGAAGLLARLGGTPWAVVTSGSRDMTTRRFARLGFPMPSVAVFGEDVKRGKPDPECYREASERLQLRPADCIAIEDAPAGITSARSAGCHVIAITSTHAASGCADAHEILGGLEQVAARLAPLLARR
jgi:sugar-phosphatase